MYGRLSAVRPRVGLVLLLAAVVAGCGPTLYQVVRPPERDAELYPVSERRGDIAVAVDEIDQPQRLKRYFGINLLEQGILPINITVSNYGKRRVALHPGDVLLYRGRAIVDPVPLEAVIRAVDEAHPRLGRETRGQIEAYLEDVSLQELLVGAGDNADGVLFFELPERPRREEWRGYFTVSSLFRDSRLRMKLVVQELDAGERLGFGPFGLSHGPARGWRD